MLLTPPPCLSPEAPHRLEGVLIARTFPGPPNFESVKAGDRPERYWLLRLPHPICVAASPSEAGAKNVREIQLILKPEDFARHRALQGKKVTAEGDLMSALSGHHHTPILLDNVELKAR